MATNNQNHHRRSSITWHEGEGNGEQWTVYIDAIAYHVFYDKATVKGQARVAMIKLNDGKEIAIPATITDRELNRIKRVLRIDKEDSDEKA